MFFSDFNRLPRLPARPTAAGKSKERVSDLGALAGGGHHCKACPASTETEEMALRRRSSGPPVQTMGCFDGAKATR